MIIHFPTGSIKPNPDGIAGALYFFNDGRWLIKCRDGLPEEEMEKITEFVDFIKFTISRADFVKEFHEHKKSIQNKDFDQWRRETFRLIVNKKEEDLQ